MPDAVDMLPPALPLQHPTYNVYKLDKRKAGIFYASQVAFAVVIVAEECLLSYLTETPLWYVTLLYLPWVLAMPLMFYFPRVFKTVQSIRVHEDCLYILHGKQSYPMLFNGKFRVKVHSRKGKVHHIKLVDHDGEWVNAGFLAKLDELALELEARLSELGEPHRLVHKVHKQYLAAPVESALATLASLAVIASYAWVRLNWDHLSPFFAKLQPAMPFIWIPVAAFGFYSMAKNSWWRESAGTLLQNRDFRVLLFILLVICALGGAAAGLLAVVQLYISGQFPFE